AARDRVQPFRSALGEFALQSVLELGITREFFKAAPVLRAVLSRFVDLRAHGVQVQLALLAGANLFTLGNLYELVLVHRFKVPFTSSMARTAAGDIAHAGLAVGGLQLPYAYSVFGNQVRAQRVLVGETPAVHLHGIAGCRRQIAHVEYLVARPQILAGIAMAAQAPLHLQRLLLVHQRHGVHRAMTGVTANSLGDMDAVIEEDEVRQRVHPRPLQRFARAVAGAHRFEQRGIGPDLRVAVHTRLGGRNPGKTGRLHRGVAVAAIDA